MSTADGRDSTWKEYWKRYVLPGTLFGSGLMFVVTVAYREWTALIALAASTGLLLALFALLSFLRYRWVLPFWRRRLHPPVVETQPARPSPTSQRRPFLRLRYVALVTFVALFLAAAVFPIFVLSLNPVVGVALGLGVGTANVVVTYFVGRSNRQNPGAPIW